VFALLKLAVPIAFLPSQSTLQETVELLKLSGVTCLFASEHLYPHAAAAAKAIGLPEEGIFILQGDVTGKVSLPSLIEDVKARGLPKTVTRTVQDDTLAYLMFSSGTTGLPKGYFIHANLPIFLKLNGSSDNDLASKHNFLHFSVGRHKRGDCQGVHGKVYLHMAKNVRITFR
jgi:acyl-CoA synthetase (AMP-forming)/AMP-acid ligase II